MPITPEIQGSNYEDILTAIEKQIYTKLGIDPSLVYLVDDENREPEIKSTNKGIVTIAPRAMTPDVGEQTGGGAFQFQLAYTWDAIIVTSLWTSFQVDQVGKMDAWFKDATRGILPIYRKLFQGLEQFMPKDGSGNCYLSEPLRITPGGMSIIPGVQTKLRRARSEWGMNFLQNMTS